MADLSDVESVLAALLTQTIYPNGTGSPSIIATACKIYRGWPVPRNLDVDLKNGIVNVSVFPMGNETNVTKYQRNWFELPCVTPTLSASVVNNTITFLGTPSSPLNVAAIVNGQAYVYPVQVNDTLNSIATGLAALINVNIPATSSGSVITISGNVVAQPPAMHLSETGAWGRRFGGALLGSMAGYWPVKAMNLAITGIFGKRFGGAILASMAAYWPTPGIGITVRIEGVGSVVREIKRQKRGFQISFWCSTPAVRDAISGACDSVLALTDYLALPDGMQARLRYERSTVSDKGENEALYRRDLIYSVEYGTTQTMTLPKVAVQKFAISGGLDPSAPAIETIIS